MSRFKVSLRRYQAQFLQTQNDFLLVYELFMIIILENVSYCQLTFLISYSTDFLRDFLITDLMDI